MGGLFPQGMKLTTHLLLVPKSRVCGAIPPSPQYILLAWCIVKHRDNFTFTLFVLDSGVHFVKTAEEESGTSSLDLQ